MKKTDKKVLFGFLLLFGLILVLAVLSVWGRHRDTFDYEAHLDETVFSVDETDVTLREFGYYIYEVEAYVDQQAKAYDSGSPQSYWNVHFSAGKKSRFLKDMAKDTAVNTCLAEIIYADMAKQDGYELTAEEKDTATEQAATLLSDMTKAQIEKTGLTQELVQKIELRKALAAGYAQDYVQKVDLQGYEGAPSELISGNGAYFQKEILPKHHVVFAKKLLNELYFGKITVNSGK
ncbi:hypothetical protein KQI22_11505 [Kineothrix sp. MSJ-39]|uniref:hypothetical protein n=1 Tax=Kineothrix sp. MSJ-39 TaxID=2841533 RepID=UPI001C106C8D|nr:hypothetical protein [Kineothrix sp. MSJ-39]MBU5430680.1 hypothetical protein [Kineothrix sp. MSJ-39]